MLCPLGCRYGKALVINMMDVDLLESVENQLNQVSPGLYSQLLSKELLQEERYCTCLLLPTNFILDIPQKDLKNFDDILVSDWFMRRRLQQSQQ